MTKRPIKQKQEAKPAQQFSGAGKQIELALEAHFDKVLPGWRSKMSDSTFQIARSSFLAGVDFSAYVAIRMDRMVQLATACQSVMEDVRNAAISIGAEPHPKKTQKARR